MTDAQLESMATSAILFGEARRLALSDLRNGKTAEGFIQSSLATELPSQAVELIKEVERLQNLLLDYAESHAAATQVSGEIGYGACDCELCVEARKTLGL